MKKNIFKIVTLMASVLAGSEVFSQATITLPSIISTDFQCTANNTYLITGKVYVKDGATIFIDEGTVLKGTPAATNELASALVITRTGRIEATGSAENPIVFTTTLAAPVKGTGYWGGVVILGSAPINQTTDQQIEGINLPSVPPGVDVFYGGGSMGAGNATENSGIMNYVRIEYAGAAIAPNNELNSLTCGGVGNGTFIDFVQAVYGADDAFEFFGGTVNAKHLVALGPDDDAFDFDFGYSGNIQFAVSVENFNKPAYSANPNGIESDGDATGNVASLPRTKAVISNMTVIGMVNATQAGPQPAGRALLQGAHIRRNSSYIIRNSIFMGFPVGVRLESTGTIADLALAQNFQNNLVHGFTAVAYQGNATTAIALPASNTSILGETGFSNATIDLTNPFDETAPDFRPSLTSPAATGASFTGLPGGANGFTTTTYRGAFSTSTAWTNSWTSFF